MMEHGVLSIKSRALVHVKEPFKSGQIARNCAGEAHLPSKTTLIGKLREGIGLCNNQYIQWQTAFLNRLFHFTRLRA